MKKAFSPTISRFNGMTISINPKEPQHRGRPHIHVKTSDKAGTYTIPDLELLAGDELTSSLRRLLSSWVQSSFPEKQPNGVYTTTVVSDLLMQDWLTIQNGQIPPKPNTAKPIVNLIPNPQEIVNLAGKVKPKQSSFHDRAQIVKVAVTEGKPFHLDAEFADGAKKRINIAAMYEGFDVAPLYKRHLTAQEIFATVQHDRWQVWWGDPGEESEIGHTDLYSAGEALKSS